MAEFQLSPIAFDDLFTFSRSTEATYWDMYGRLRTAAIDERRIAYDPTTLRLSEVNQTSVNGWNITTLAVGQLVTITLQDSAYVYNVGWRIRVSNPTYVDSSFDPGFWGTVEESEPGLLRVRVSKIETVPDISGGGGTIGAWNVVRAMGIQVENGATNLIAYSEDFTQWSQSNDHTYTFHPSGAPDGGGYYTITKGATGVSIFGIGPVNSQLALSVYYKNPSLTSAPWRMILRNQTTGSNITEWVRIEIDGSFTGAGQVEQIGEWTKVTYFRSVGNGFESGDVLSVYVMNSSGDEGMESLDVWGYQAEVCTSPVSNSDWRPSSYIPTNGEAVTRASEQVRINPITSWFNQGQGTIVVSGYRPPVSNADWQFQFNDVTTASRIFIRDAGTANSIQAIYDWGNDQAGLAGPNNIAGQTYRAAFSFINASTIAVAVNGQYMGVQPVGENENEFLGFWLGMDNSGRYANSKTIEEFQFHPYAMSESQLVEASQ